MKIVIDVVGTSPLLMHNPRMVDPEFEINRQMKVLTGKRKKTDEDLRQIGRLEWFGGMYEVEGVVVQPTSKLRKCLINAGRISKQGKSIERALSLSELNVPLIYEGPKELNKLFEDKRYTSRLSVGIGSKRVMRVRPQFSQWGLRVKGLFIEDAGLNLSEFEHIAELAGLSEGIGDNRVNGYGRFTIKVTQDE
tara:strand:+ start:281 stop:859 length:579 start_codon:yes stop_codon:yes gene_type:complete